MIRITNYIPVLIALLLPLLLLQACGGTDTVTKKTTSLATIPDSDYYFIEKVALTDMLEPNIKEHIFSKKKAYKVRFLSSAASTVANVALAAGKEANMLKVTYTNSAAATVGTPVTLSFSETAGGIVSNIYPVTVPRGEAVRAVFFPYGLAVISEAKLGADSLLMSAGQLYRFGLRKNTITGKEYKTENNILFYISKENTPGIGVAGYFTTKAFEGLVNLDFKFTTVVKSVAVSADVKYYYVTNVTLDSIIFGVDTYLPDGNVRAKATLPDLSVADFEKGKVHTLSFKIDIDPGSRAGKNPYLVSGSLSGSLYGYHQEAGKDKDGNPIEAVDDQYLVTAYILELVETSSTKSVFIWGVDIAK